MQRQAHPNGRALMNPNIFLISTVLFSVVAPVVVRPLRSSKANTQNTGERRILRYSLGARVAAFSTVLGWCALGVFGALQTRGHLQILVIAAAVASVSVLLANCYRLFRFRVELSGDSVRLLGWGSKEASFAPGDLIRVEHNRRARRFVVYLIGGRKVEIPEVLDGFGMLEKFMLDRVPREQIHESALRRLALK